ncbi:MAG: 30S ribosomal protein S12 methylthiotransferase RimO [Chloroflexi bacterium]|jgi:ribosomal protein S12 methylthiotransferase|nr:30S ribosomal protein S12 methylthiotransferase RimO [Chloroflexota bacterium]MBT3669507.1 30S ribosomal protein S12 methylthiotransferase RimO [Chloroflexota bacterium]MBT4002444.1 30S ribosomal protein S12 methylthiotransferase RimO [Chloroflexota bacterium]MBT4304474.1 30S ribosomal protein S12 methylthiotransferase RimO [Chloroflexota bacterium]MBT4534185.1 30S ribosomal protein S12 methylthiotransferase RimO [Chloroflexota bacterium]
MTKDKNFHLISLGCAKNTVDSESIAQILGNNGYISTLEATDASVIIVNTCGFIGPAKEESYQVLQELAEGKSPDQLLIAAGCLTQRYGAEVVDRVPGIDGVLGTRRWMDIMSLVTKLREGTHPETLYHLPTEAITVGKDEGNILRVSTTGPSAYIKIADGCRRPCAFCAIPEIKGTLVSRPIEAILNEARVLRDQGVREIILIAQDSTDYGNDLGLKNGLAHLLKELTKSVPDVDWLRILYAYPGYVTDKLIDIMASETQILPYLDMPLQHADPLTLRRMKRPANMDWVYKTLEKMKTAMPNLALRTTFIVGYPGETEAEFQQLMNFVKEIRFDRVGAFTFSFEPGTTSEPLGDPVPEEVKQERQKRLMTLQQGISLENNQSLIEQTLDVLIEGHGEIDDSDEMISIGRSYRDAPEIDGMVFVEGQPPVGEIVPVKINGAMTYDLTGHIETSNQTIFFSEE